MIVGGFSYVDVEVTGKAVVRAVTKDSERPFRKAVWKDRSERPFGKTVQKGLLLVIEFYRRGINPTGKDHVVFNWRCQLT